MKLTDNEKRDIVTMIEEGKNLPEKFRYLLFDDSKKVEINWENKKFEIINIALPFQTIEHIDEPRSEGIRLAQQSFNFATGHKTSDWTNKLIWGDNKFVVSSLLNNPYRREIENAGGVKLIYIDPPFSVGMNYTIPVNIGGHDQYDKKPSIIENFAYRNTWNREGNSFLQMLYERVSLMRNLLRDDGVLVLRIDHHWGHYVKALLDEVFGKENFRNEIFVNRTKKNTQSSTRQMMLTTSIESLFVYSKSDQFEYLDTKYKLQETRKGYWRAADDSAGKRNPPERILNGKTFYPPKGSHFKFSQENLEKKYKDGSARINEKTGRIQYFVQPTEEGQLDTMWTDIPGYSFSTKYPTENHEKLLERVIRACSTEKDLVCDFFNGSGTTAAVCERMNRKWIATDVGKFSIHVTRKRLIEVQRKQKKNDKNWRPFEILNIGKYQKQQYLNDGMQVRNQDLIQTRKSNEKKFENLVLEAYRANKVEDFKTLNGIKNGTFISIGPINYSVTRDYVQQVMKECVDNNIINVEILGFGYEMGLFPSIEDEASNKGLSLKYKQIPNDIFNEEAVKNNEVHFFDISFIEVRTHIKGNKIALELTDFKTFYNFDSYANVSGQNNGPKMFVRNGQIFEKTKNKDGTYDDTQLTKSYTDWVDYWAVDFNFQSRKELIQSKKSNGEYEGTWSGKYIFENEWQSFRTKEEELELKTSEVEILSNEITIAIRVVDIFGNDTLKVIKVNK